MVTLWLVIPYIAIENGPVEIVDLPINSMVIFARVMVEFTREYTVSIRFSQYYPIIILETTIIHEKIHYTLQ